MHQAVDQLIHRVIPGLNLLMVRDLVTALLEPVEDIQLVARQAPDLVILQEEVLVVTDLPGVALHQVLAADLLILVEVLHLAAGHPILEEAHPDHLVVVDHLSQVEALPDRLEEAVGHPVRVADPAVVLQDPVEVHPEEVVVNKG